MPHFNYSGLQQGRKTSGRIEAADRRAAQRKLRAQGVQVTKLMPTKATGKESSKRDTALIASPVPAREKARPARKCLKAKKATGKQALPFLRKLLQLHSSGMSAGDALHLMSQRMTDPALKGLCEGVYRYLSEGSTLATAMRQHPEVFTETQSHLIEAGEATGNLVPILENLIENLETQAELAKKVRSAMAYPVFISLFAMAVVAVFLFYLLPNIQGMMTQLGGELNIAAKLMIGLSGFAFNQGPFLLAGLFAAALLLVQWRKTEKGLQTTDQWLLQVPLVSAIVRHSEICGLSNVLAILLGNGVNTTESLRLASAVVRNRVFSARFQASRTLINDGAPYSTAMQRYALLPEMDIDILGIGESTGNLVDSFREIYRTHAEELSSSLKLATNLVAGLALGFAFSLVVIITFGIALSIMDMSQSVLAS